MASVDEIIKPKDCFFGMCLPVTKEEFLQSLEGSSNKNFFKLRRSQLGYNPGALWESDYLPFVNLFLRKKKELENLGVTFCANFSTQDLPRIKDFKTAAIFAHHDDDIRKIELFDGLQGVDTLVKNIPHGYDKILDLTMCRSVPLQTEVKKAFKNCLVVANKLQANPEFRLLCYSKAILFLHQENMNYIDAIAKVRILIKNSMPPKNE